MTDNARDRRDRRQRVVWLLAAGVLAACRPAEPSRVSGGDSSRGRAVVERIGCGTCHVIPGAHGPNGIVGPSLAGFGSRPYLAGTLPNQPAVLMRFVRDAPALLAGGAMPDMPLDEQEARDVAAFLYTLR